MWEPRVSEHIHRVGILVIENSAVLALNVSALVVVFFSSHLLVLRSFERRSYLPLAICLSAIGVVISQPTVALLLPSFQTTFLMMSLPAILLIAPSLWLYVEGLTSPTPWRLSRKSLRHFIPAGLGALIALSFSLLPTDVVDALLLAGNDGILTEKPRWLANIVYVLLIAIFALVVTWPVQSGVYFYKIFQRLRRYRRYLKDLFSSTDSREMRWLSWLLFVGGGAWLAAAAYIVVDNLFFSVQLDPILVNMALLVTLWSIAIWGLRQKPGFDELNEGETKNALGLVDDLPQKYQRSALDEQQSKHIAQKIEKAMSEDKLYLDASLSMQRLAKHITTSPNYISQTLNVTLGMNFFDYVNKYRVEAAKGLLALGSDTVLDVAMHVGFNSKSSFYTAFKKEVGQTPSQYRKSLGT
ncbi:AraC family transcriptional regulator [Marinimicrobium sp. ABcell2]|uniref:helix-turn-helix domain-containing protein n=1 Tax=Marinimicrobium sp. ABcell2 TaxID=3069751 RepID=UPI0027B420FA|nr:AraC family transcriptional regulator [Marinimicrobium sp. ABcell2]MDQ2078211.1 AraC family transcriptional regulator [Marinimicrobium sp. ABcell2]